MLRLIFLLISMMLVASLAQGEPQRDNNRAFQGDAVAEKIHEQCLRLLRQESSGGDKATELLHLRLRRLYAARNFQPLWTKRRTVAELMQALEASVADGLNPADYHLARIREFDANPTPTPDLKARRDILLTKSFLALATHLRYGKVDPATLDPNWNINAGKNFGVFDKKLQQAVEAESVAAVLEELRPHDASYNALKKALARYRTIVQRGGWRAVPAGETLKAGARSSRMPLLRQRLKLSGDLAPEAADTVTVYTPELVEAVKRFQRRNGMVADGSVGAGTLRIMNISATRRVEQLRLNLDRYRWFLHEIEPTCIVVNIPSYTLHYLENGALRWEARVIVGQPLRETPIFKAMMPYIIINPKWIVPETIMEQDVLPALNKDTAYLNKKKLRVVDEEGTVVDPASIDWSHYSAANLPYRLQQGAGDQGALGRIKFMMPNRHTVYLHDTPNRELFAKSSRALSSGCVRVQHPEELARLLLHDSVRWSAAMIQQSIATEKTRSVMLAQPVPVYLLYLTAIPNGSGVRFCDDIYNRDAKALKALNTRMN